MAWTAPRTWTTGELVTAAMMNTHVRDNLLALGAPTYAIAPPGSPSDGDDWVMVDSLTVPTYHWAFRYNAGSLNTDKWEFVGGPPYVAQSASTPLTFTTPRAGVWRVLSGGNANVTSGGDATITPYGGNAHGEGNTAANFLPAESARLAAASSISVTSAGTNSPSRTIGLAVWPVRVS